MYKETQVDSITVLLPAKGNASYSSNTIVPFTIFREGDNYKAVPMLKPEEIKMAALPSEFLFSFRDNTIYCKEQDQRTIELLKNILRELELKEQHYR